MLVETLKVLKIPPEYKLPCDCAIRYKELLSMDLGSTIQELSELLNNFPHTLSVATCRDKVYECHRKRCTVGGNMSPATPGFLGQR